MPVDPVTDPDDTADSTTAGTRSVGATFSQRLAKVLVVPLAVLLAALLLVFFVLFQTGTVVGPSMKPTLQDHDYVLLTKGLPDPRRGDVVILYVVENGQHVEWVKRVIGIGGDTVDVAGDVITVNGAPEQFPHKIMTSGESRPVEHLVVPHGQLFVAGDNRGISEDSRYVGTFPAGSVRGKVVAIYAPIERIGPVPGP
jgi:signal peptidase I